MANFVCHIAAHARTWYYMCRIIIREYAEDFTNTTKEMVNWKTNLVRPLVNSKTTADSESIGINTG